METTVKGRKLTMEYEKRIKKHLADYKNTVLKIKEKGTWRGKEYAHILPIDEKEKDRKNRITLNILAPYRQDFFDGTLSEINYHINCHHLNSSQAMCINFFYPLYKEKKLDLVLSALGIKSKQIHCDTVQFEKTSHIDNEGGFRPTSFDFYFEIEAHTKLKFYFEIKYTEKNFGPAKPDNEHIRKYECVYKNYLQNIQDRYKDMELFFANYQIMRNLIHIKEDSHVVFIYPQENTKIREEAEKAAEILKESAKSHFHFLTWEKLLTHIDKTYKELPKKLQNSIKDFRKKYMPKNKLGLE